MIAERLQALDRELLDATLKESGTDTPLIAALARDAEAELAPFLARMPPARGTRSHCGIRPSPSRRVRPSGS